MEQGQPFIVATGIDTLKINVKQLDPEGKPAKEQIIPVRLADDCSRWQEQAQEAREPVATSITFHGARMVMYPNGAQAWKYLLRNDCIELKIAPRLKLPMLAKITCLSEYLWTVGNVEAVLNEVEGLLYSLFGEYMSLQAAQIDMCIDVVGWKPPHNWQQVFITKAVGKKVYGESEKDREHYRGRDLETILFSGHGRPLSCKMYNKTVEIRQMSGKVWMYDRWRGNGWNGEDPVWRIEFSVEREGLHQTDLDHVKEVIDNIGRLWEYCTHEWLRLAKPTATKNRSRWGIHPMWQQVQHAFDGYSPQEVEGLGPLVRGRKRQENIEQLTAQIAGCITTLAAWDKEIDPHSETLEEEILDLACKKVRERWRKTGTFPQDAVREKKFIYSQVP